MLGLSFCFHSNLYHSCINLHWEKASLFSVSHTHLHTERRESLIVSGPFSACEGHPLNNCPFYASLFPCPSSPLHSRTPSISPFTLTLFLTPLVSRTQGVREERQRVWKKTETKVWLLREIKCNFTVNLLWYIISQQWDVGWYEPCLAPVQSS